MNEVEINPGFQRLKSLVTTLEDNRSSILDDFEDDEDLDTVSALEKCEYASLSHDEPELFGSIINLDGESLENDVLWLFSLEKFKNNYDSSDCENWLRSAWESISIPNNTLQLNKLLHPGTKLVPKSQSEWSLNTLSCFDTSPRQTLLEHSMMRHVTKHSTSNEQLNNQKELSNTLLSRMHAPKHFKSGSTPNAGLYIEPAVNKQQTNKKYEVEELPISQESNCNTSRSESDLLDPTPIPKQMEQSNSRSVSNLVAPNRTANDIMALARQQADQLKEAVGQKGPIMRKGSQPVNKIEQPTTEIHFNKRGGSMLPQPKAIPRLKSRLPVNHSIGGTLDRPSKVSGAGDMPHRLQTRSTLQQPKVHYI